MAVKDTVIIYSIFAIEKDSRERWFNWLLFNCSSNL